MSAAGSDAKLEASRRISQMLKALDFEKNTFAITISPNLLHFDYNILTQKTYSISFVM